MPRSAAQRLVVHCGIFYSLLTGTIAGALRVFVHGPLKYCGRYCIPWTRCGVRAKRDQFPVRAKDVDGEQRYSQNCSFSSWNTPQFHRAACQFYLGSTSYKLNVV